MDRVRTLIRRKNQDGTFDVAILNEFDDIISYIHIMPNGIPDHAEELKEAYVRKRWKTPNDFFDWYRKNKFEKTLKPSGLEASQRTPASELEKAIDSGYEKIKKQKLGQVAKEMKQEAKTK